jgi:hypothetical protein
MSWKKSCRGGIFTTGGVGYNSMIFTIQKGGWPDYGISHLKYVLEISKFTTVMKFYFKTQAQAKRVVQEICRENA